MLGLDREAAGYIVGEELFFMGLPVALEAFRIDKQKPIVVIISGREAAEKLQRYNQEERLSKGRPPILAAYDAKEAVRLVSGELVQRDARFAKETNAVLAAIGRDHPVFCVCA